MFFFVSSLDQELPKLIELSLLLSVPYEWVCVRTSEPIRHNHSRTIAHLLAR
ncbi:hypothetical protein NITHO_460034 [Nitrolancea hollandica Lb]|uniref:Uncharacterized protein n=1 Tax=Nitrolancea hollandica Lb TaxID=1129897 RepID=I4EKI6_9BACT|nr:hypothetical protein NITHO_460034 [Nitrolancea hollandica Lb]